MDRMIDDRKYVLYVARIQLYIYNVDIWSIALERWQVCRVETIFLTLHRPIFFHADAMLIVRPIRSTQSIGR